MTSLSLPELYEFMDNRGATFKYRILISRVNSIGDPDQSFNKGIGQALGLNALGFDLHLDTSDNIFVCGSSMDKTKQGYLIKLAEWNGEYDKSLNGSGWKSFDFDSDQRKVGTIHSLFVDADKRIIINGSSHLNNGASIQDYVAVFKERGQIDHTFGEGGIYFGEKECNSGQLIAIDAGTYITPYETFDANKNPAYIEYSLSSPEANVKKNTHYSFQGSTRFHSDVAYAPTQKAIFVCSRITEGDVQGYVLAKFSKDGVLDKGFGENGGLKIFFNSGDFLLRSMKIFNGKVYVLGSMLETKDIGISVHNLDGSFHTDFSGDGKLVSSMSNLHLAPADLVVKPDGTIYVVGTQNINVNSVNNKIFIIAYRSDGDVLTYFGQNMHTPQGMALYEDFASTNDVSLPKGKGHSYFGSRIDIDSKGRLVFTGLYVTSS
ncbi:hypothetical protein ITG09_17895 [Vibrio cyclitrophicus]|nr:hypothetical protein [Vibrio cyclitrophicus]UPR54824.1 hypothetical protein ITG09_17895 [Vibrio cyclitrophicus]